MRRSFESGRRRLPRWSRFVLGIFSALAGGFLGLGSIHAQEAPEVRFVKPLHLATALGPTRIELEVTTPPGEPIQRIELKADGKPLITLTQPPWHAEWQAGDGSTGHTLEAIVVTAGGRKVRSVILTSPLRVNQVESVDLVNLYAVVKDRSGEYVKDLDRRDFKVLENGRTQRIDRFSTGRKPLKAAIVLDTSNSMNGGSRLPKAKKAALKFLEVLDPHQDQGLVVTFNDEVTIAQDITTDVDLLADAVRNTTAVGGTALYDAIWKAARKLEGFDGRRVLVLLSDGRDVDISGLQPGSLHTMEEALDQALRSEIMIFTIGLGRKLDTECADDWNRTFSTEGCNGKTAGQVLQQLADSTGGRAVKSASAGRLRVAFDEVEKDLRHQYSIAYVSDDPVRDGRWREIKAFTPGRDLEVITRKGYFATERKKPKTVPVEYVAP